MAFMEGKNRWKGTASELLELLQGSQSPRVLSFRDLPSSPEKLSGELRRLAPNLRAVGLDVTFYRESKRDRRRIITIKKLTPQKERVTGNLDASDANNQEMEKVWSA